MNANLKYQMKNKQYILHTDPGHGWVAVKMREIEALGIADSISLYSYVKGNTVYLEEDCDAALFFDAYQAMFGKRPQFRHSYLDRTPIRYYNRYQSASVPA